MNYDKLTKEQLLGIHKDTLEYLEEITIEDKDMNLKDNENILITRDLKNNSIKIVLRRS